MSEPTAVNRFVMSCGDEISHGTCWWEITGDLYICTQARCDLCKTLVGLPKWLHTVEALKPQGVMQ